MSATPNVDRTAKATDHRPMPTVLKRGRHATPDDGMCITEAVAWIAGEPHSDRPECCCPVLAAFGRAWNDSMRSDDERDRLLRWVPLLVGTRAGADVERQRSEMALMWLINVCAATWLDAVGLTNHAATLRVMTDVDQSQLEAAKAAVGAAAWAAVGAAVRDDAALVATWEDVARAAAWHVVTSAISAAVRADAWDVAMGVVGAFTRAAACLSAIGVAKDVAAPLVPTVTRLQGSADELFGRMIAMRSV